MSESQFRVVAKVDPQTGAGTQKVKQDLRSIQTEARATGKALSGFNQSSFETTVNNLTKGIATLEQRMAKLIDTTTRGKVANDNAASSNDKHYASLLRVTQAIDAEAAEQVRMNQLLKEAKTLLDANLISQVQYERVQRLAAEAGRGQVAVTGAQRIGMQQLGFQLGDVATMYSLGAKPAQIFASQIGQVSQALMLMGGDRGGALGKVAGFLGGPWGIALTVGTILLGPFIGKLFETSDALETATEKMRKDAAETETTRQAKEAFSRTLEGVTAVLRENKKALDELDNSHKTAARRALENAIVQQDRLAQIKDETFALIGLARAQIELNNARALGPETKNARVDPNLAAAREAAERLDALEKKLATTQTEIEESQRQIDRAAARRQVELGSRTRVEEINDRYDAEIRGLEKKAAAEGNVTVELRKQVRAINDRRDAEVKAAQAAERATSASDGVARFKSRRGAIGIAGRELQRRGLDVGENDQFGGVQGNHPGMGNAAHGAYAIDVNQGSGVVEANVPDLKAKFDQLARSYQGRGYKVLWNGWVYSPNGNGPTKRIPAGQNQHKDHMHVEAPQTIVGKPTQAGNESDAIGDENKEATKQAQMGDFVQGIVNRAASQGIAQDAATQLQAAIDAQLAEFKRRFDQEASPEQAGIIKKALTDADARETARRFDEAYVDPLRRLRDLQGKVGLDREVLNAQLDEAARLGRDLTTNEKNQIAISIRRGDAYKREAEILAQVQGPLAEYKATIEALNALLGRGEISQQAYNARIADLNAGITSGMKGNQGIDPGTGQSYDQIAQTAEVEARYANELALYAQHREQLLQMGIDYNALEKDVEQRKQDELRGIEQATMVLRLQAAQSIGNSLLQVAEQTIGKQNAVYKTLFVATKAFAIAEGIVNFQSALAKALNAAPFPANIPAIASVAAIGAGIISNIASVSLALKDGGYVQGPGGPRSDSVKADLSNGEFVVNAAATSRNRALLEAINDNQVIHDTRQTTTALAVGPSAGRPLNLRIDSTNVPGVEFDVKRITENDVEVIASRVVARDAEKVVSGRMRDPNSTFMKTLGDTTTARRKKG